VELAEGPKRAREVAAGENVSVAIVAAGLAALELVVDSILASRRWSHTMTGETLKVELPKLPKLDTKDVDAVRSFLLGKILGRTAAFLLLIVLVLGFTGAVRFGLQTFFGVTLPPWAYPILIGPALLAVAVQIFVEWRDERNRRILQRLAVTPGVEQTGYFRIGPYNDTAQDRAQFRRPDRAEERVLEWITASTRPPLYLNRRLRMWQKLAA
jgi:hypothetical protein